VNSGGHALTVLEFSRVLELVAGHASSAAGAARTRDLHPLDSDAAVTDEHARVEAMRAMVESEAGWHPEPIPDLAAALGRLRVDGGARKQRHGADQSDEGRSSFEVEHLAPVPA